MALDPSAVHSGCCGRSGRGHSGHGPVDTKQSQKVKTASLRVDWSAARHSSGSTICYGQGTRRLETSNSSIVGTGSLESSLRLVEYGLAPSKLFDPAADNRVSSQRACPPRHAPPLNSPQTLAVRMWSSSRVVSLWQSVAVVGCRVCGRYRHPYPAATLAAIP